MRTEQPAVINIYKEVVIMSEAPVINKGGRPPVYKTPEEMQEVIDRYFETTKSPVIHKNGVEYIPGPYTMTGLAIALGFTSRQALWNYEGKEGFVDVVARARARVIEYAEGRLYDKDGSNGAKFALGNFNDGWSDKTTVEHTGNIIHSMQLEPGQAEAMLQRALEARERRLAPVIDGEVISAKTEPIPVVIQVDGEESTD
jgi:hypothetical protein